MLLVMLLHSDADALYFVGRGWWLSFGRLHPVTEGAVEVLECLEAGLRVPGSWCSRDRPRSAWTRDTETSAESWSRMAPVELCLGKGRKLSMIRRDVREVRNERHELGSHRVVVRQVRSHAFRHVYDGFHGMGRRAQRLPRCPPPLLGRREKPGLLSGKPP